MAGSIDNTAVWSEADVLIADEGSALPTAGAAFSGSWGVVGLLDGSAGFGETESVDSTDHNAWGYGVIRTTRRNTKIQRTFTMLEDNATTLDLQFDTTGLTTTVAGHSGTLAQRDLGRKFLIAFELRTGQEVKRRISAGYAQVSSLGDITEGEDNLQSRQVTVDIYPNDAEHLWTVYRGPQTADLSAINVSPATSTKVATSTTQLVVVASFTDDPTTLTVTNDCTYTTTDATKATVSATGLVTFVATGPATITATYGGMTDTCAITVS